MRLEKRTLDLDLKIADTHVEQILVGEAVPGEPVTHTTPPFEISAAQKRPAAGNRSWREYGKLRGKTSIQRRYPRLESGRTIFYQDLGTRHCNGVPRDALAGCLLIADWGLMSADFRLSCLLRANRQAAVCFSWEDARRFSGKRTDKTFLRHSRHKGGCVPCKYSGRGRSAGAKR